MIIELKVKRDGFTLIEILISLTMFSIIIGAIFSFSITQRKYFAVQDEVSHMIQNARVAMEIIAGETMMAGYDPQGTGFVGIPYQASQLEINTDLNGDGDLEDSNEKITYAYNSSNKTITRKTGTAGVNQPLAENVQSFNFIYLDDQGNPTTIPANIRQIQIAITVQTSKPDPQYTANSGYRTYTLTSRVTPRNLAY